MPILDAETRVKNLQQNAVLLSISRGRLRTTKRISSSSIQSDADPDILHVSKDIMESDKLDAIGQLFTKSSNFLSKICLPGPFKSGMYLLPVRLIDSTLKQLELDKAELVTLLADFMAFYEAAHQFAQADEVEATVMLDANPGLAQFAASKAQLGSLWNPLDYPTPDQVRARFFFEFSVMEMQTPGKLKAISKELYQRELEKIQNVWEGATEKISGVLMEEFQKLTSNLAERLTTGEDGKQKSLRASTIQKMNDWFSLFDARNLASDEQLAAMVGKARRLVNGIDLETIKEDVAARAELSGGFQGLVEEINQAVIDRPARRMDFTE